MARWPTWPAGLLAPSCWPRRPDGRSRRWTSPSWPSACAEARRRGLEHLVTLVHADLARWRPAPGSHALILCPGWWERAVFGVAAAAVAPGGLLGWEALTAEARRARPGLPPDWCLGPDEPAALLPAGFTAADQHDVPGHHGLMRRQLLARRTPPRQ
jgi:hypothetical protein